MVRGRVPFGARRSLRYAGAFAIPIALTYVVTWLRLPAFLFEHLIVLLVVGIAVPWGLGPAIVAAVVSVAADNVLLREPFGQPTISGYRDAVDLALFATVAVIVSGLMRRANSARVVAQAAAESERRAREDLDSLIATITHDLATPLSVLRNTVHIVKCRGTAEVDLDHLLHRLDTATARASSLLRMMSDAQAVDAHRLALNVDTHNLAGIVMPIVTMMDRTSERHPLIVTLPEQPVTVRADAERIQQVLENLIGNAIKYSPDGGQIEVSVEGTAGQAVVRVRDHGIGIPAEVRPRIFERSYRAPNADAHARGLGLGLSIAAEVVKRHQGTIESAPAEGRGTIFTVRLPALVPPAVPCAQSQHASCIDDGMPNTQATRWQAQVPDQPNDVPMPDTDEPGSGGDEVPATPPTEPEPVPIEDPRPDTQPPGPYVV